MKRIEEITILLPDYILRLIRDEVTRMAVALAFDNAHGLDTPIYVDDIHKTIDKYMPIVSLKIAKRLIDAEIARREVTETTPSASDTHSAPASP